MEDGYIRSVSRLHTADLAYNYKYHELHDHIIGSKDYYK